MILLVSRLSVQMDLTLPPPPPPAKKKIPLHSVLYLNNEKKRGMTVINKLGNLCFTPLLGFNIFFRTLLLIEMG